jgi:SMI1/KNR4 family protein SUKH-1/type VI secretion system (T6SS) immunity protein Tdi1
LEDFGRLPGTCTHRGADPSWIAACERDWDFTFPPDHRSVLLRSNGIEVYAGHLRLFGIAATDSIDAIIWNQHEFWKFAWGDRCSGYWCFGETAFGDQYAYSLDSLRAGKTGIYFLDALSMTPQVVADTFAEFFEREFARSAKEPYDVMIPAARQKFGQLELDSHVVYVPSPLLGGTEDAANLQKMNARAAMIASGDIALQLDAGPSEGLVKAVAPYEDEQGLTRLRLVWT